MLFGPDKIKTMKTRILNWIFWACLLTLTACQSAKTASSIYFLSPESGTEIYSNTEIPLKIQFLEGQTADSIVYFIDGQRFAAVKDTQSVKLDTKAMKMGNRLIAAKVYRGAEAQEITTSILVKPAKAPQKLTYKVEATLPHDTSSYTQGLEFHDGIFYESDGEYGGSSLRKVDPQSGKVLKRIDISSDKFAEGLTVLGDKVIQLTWQENMGLVYDKSSFKLLSTFPYQNSRVGWGLCNDGQKIYKSDGSNMIYILNSKTYQEEGFIEVYDSNGPVDQLNELEYIDGKIYANIYQSRRVVSIDPKTGAVAAEIDFSGLSVSNANADVLNGIAQDAATRRIWVTGKKWNKLFQIKVLN